MQSSPAPLPAMLPDYEREKLNAEILLNKAAYGACLRFNGKLRDEVLNGEIFYTLKEAQIVIERWRRHYNTIRPHSSLGYVPPAPESILPRSNGMFYASPRSTSLGDLNRRNSNLSSGPP
jgi:hypothetical protein